MSNKKIEKSVLVIFILLAILLISAQCSMKMRMSDTNALCEFSAARVNLTIETLNVNGFKLHYAKTGNDSLPTLFFVHGSPGSWDAFKVYMQDSDLLAKFRMVSIDRPGFGYSQFGDAKNLVDQSAIISPLLKHIANGKPIHIVGHSLGGPLAVKLVAENPNIFSSMVILAGSVDPAEEPKENWRGVIYNTPLKYLWPGAFRPSNTEIWLVKKELIPLSKQFENIKCDVWIVHGDADRFVPVGNAYYAQKMLVNAKSVHLKILSGAPHFIPWAPWYKYVKEILLTFS